MLGCSAVLDLYAFCMEETGLAEMKDLIVMSGGLLVLGETFSDQQSIFQASFRKAYIFDEDHDLSQSLATSSFFSVNCSGDILVSGVLGSGYAL